MKTRQELILEFMLALASGFYASGSPPEESEDVYRVAEILADEYLSHR
jgi:hypothetical protein